MLHHSGPHRTGNHYKAAVALLVCLILLVFLGFRSHVGADPMCSPYQEQPSDHFDGKLFFNPGFNERPDEVPQKRTFWWFWRFMAGPTWHPVENIPPAQPPVARVPKGSLVITPVGHATFLIQMDGLNILTDPIWSKRCSPLSWAGPKRYRTPGIRFEDLPPIDAVLVSHNHYDHLDIPTLEKLAGKGARRSITPLGNRDLIYDAGIPVVDELDWWQKMSLSEDVTVTVVPAQHFSSRTLWDRNEALWGGFVISGPSGNVYFAGDTGYGPHFREIARRFSPIRAALLPIAPYWPQDYPEKPSRNFSKVHMGPAEAVQAHIDLGAGVSIAAHFQVFQLGVDAFDAAPGELKSALLLRNLKPESFLALLPGTTVKLAGAPSMACLPVEKAGNRGLQLNLKPESFIDPLPGTLNRTERGLIF